MHCLACPQATHALAGGSRAACLQVGSYEIVSGVISSVGWLTDLPVMLSLFAGNYYGM
jgi:hypothetical protein